ncbi:MAG: hypothetical protein GY779_14550, partial [Gammaproteobacteria bacterium]|nr:hypothetical protein [Gammaproteobacteria bacterium]
ALSIISDKKICYQKVLRQRRWRAGAVFYYRTRNGTEFDLVLDSSSGILPIEIKFGRQTTSRQLALLQQFVLRHELPVGIVVSNSNQVRMLSEKIVQVPCGCL